MAKWECEICGNEFDNFHAQGFDSKIYCPLCYFKKKYVNAVSDYETTMAERNKLEQQCKKQKEVIDNTIECINKYESIRAYYEYIDEDGYDEYNCDEDFKKELLDILDEVSNNE